MTFNNHIVTAGQCRVTFVGLDNEDDEMSSHPEQIETRRSKRTARIKPTTLAHVCYIITRKLRFRSSTAIIAYMNRILEHTDLDLLLRGPHGSTKCVG